MNLAQNFLTVSNPVLGSCLKKKKTTTKTIQKYADTRDAQNEINKIICKTTKTNLVCKISDEQNITRSKISFYKIRKHHNLDK